ncbi:SDR family oxidoreductase [Pseudomonas typographi]|uniref:SDR family oxidoreductase n=1 Tax=Pseudomonas typographi TaxID=2715964 RepID=UPI0016828253|nr:SDR family oxidoreductase [Pseudomonas typographi]MBD1590006.1 SDR family oxidoreductase [Pseudomonas typographi]
MNRLRDKFALITGGTSGIGLETARQFMAEGATVAVTGRDETALECARQALGKAALAIRCDAGAIDEQHALAQALARQWPRLDVLYINAGDVTHLPLQAWDEARWDRLMATNLKGPFFLIQALSSLLADPASVILCGSASAHIGLAQSSAYAASKAGLLSLARTLSAELLARGIRVNGLSPGPTETPALAKLAPTPEQQQALRAQVRALVPIGRMGTPWELAKAAVFLASDESRFVVGTELLVDGGVASL